MTIGRRLSRLLGSSRLRLGALGCHRRTDAQRRERRSVDELAPELLRDIGLTPGELARLLDG